MADDVVVRWNLSRLVIGVAIAAAGVLFTLDNLSLVQAEHYLAYWPLIIVLVGVIQAVQGRTWGAYLWGLVLIVVGSWLVAENIGILTLSVWTLSPLLLVILGASIFWRGWAPPSGLRGVDGKAFIKGTAVMGSFERMSDAADFRGGDLVAIMGVCKLDLRGAAIAGDEVVIDVLAVMGGMEILVPRNWVVDPHVLPIMGGVTDKTGPAPIGGATQRLLVRGTLFMGGVDIKN